MTRRGCVALAALLVAASLIPRDAALPIIDLFAITPQAIAPHGSSLISWSASHADWASIDRGPAARERA
jgi:hypothetical protein